MRVGIIGCGIAGQAAAIALAHAGHDTTVFERFDVPQPIGAGLLLQPSGLAVLNRLGLLQSAESWGARVERLFGRTVGDRTVMDLRYRDFQPDAYGLGIHRGALFSLLHEAMRAAGVPVRTGFEVCGIEDPIRPVLIARDGRNEGPFDLVLDCAGAHSPICANLATRSRFEEYEWSALWAVCPDREGRFQHELRQVYDTARVMIGILPVGRSPASDFAGNHVALFWSLKRKAFETQRDEGIEAFRNRILEAWPESAPVVREVGSFNALTLATYCDARVRRSYKGRVIAMGDAAHATSPQLGQGANLALIDAYTLAAVLKKEKSIDTALTAYDSLRRPHIRYYQMASRALTPLFQSDSVVASMARDLAFRPLGRWPVTRTVMRTTLAGVRLFPWGRWKLPQ